MTSRSARLLAGFLILLLAACSTATNSPTPTAPATEATQPTRTLPSPTPTLAADVHGLALLPGQPPDAWTALGILENRSGWTIQDVMLSVILSDDQGTTLDRAATGLAVPLLAANDSAPFAIGFRDQAGANVRVEVSNYAVATEAPLPLGIRFLRRTDTGTGQLAVVGTLTNSNPVPVRVLDLAVAVSDSQHALLGLSSGWSGTTSIVPEESVPFLALVPAAPGGVHLVGYGAAIALDTPSTSPVELTSEPDLKQDSQGNPIVFATLKNVGSQPALARLSMVISGAGGPASVAVYDSPIPLSPGEIRPIALTQLPGLGTQLASGAQTLDGLQAKGTVDTAASRPMSAAVVDLDVEITAYERVGSSLLVHGSAHNQSGAQVLHPTVMGVLRSTKGEPWSAAEVALDSAWDSGSGTDFLLVMPLPAGIKPSEGEFDIRGVGVMP
jgi:hypothetical protein